MKDSAKRFLIPVAVVSLLSLAAMVLLQRGRNQITPVLAERLADYESLTGSAQNQIRNNFDAYEALTESEQSALRQIQAAAAADENLAHQLESFFAWWTTLDRVDRDEILQDPETEPIERIRAEVAWATGPERFAVHLIAYGREPGSANSSSVLELTTGDLDRLVSVAEELEPSNKVSLAGIDDERQRLLVRLSAVLDRMSSPSRGMPRGESGQRISELTAKVIDAIPDSVIREHLQSSPSFAQEMAVRWILWTGGQQIVRTYLSRLKVSDNDFLRYFAALSGREQSMLMKLDADRAVRTVQMDIVSSERRLPPAVLDSIRRFTQRSWFRRRPGSGPRETGTPDARP